MHRDSSPPTPCLRWLWVCALTLCASLSIATRATGDAATAGTGHAVAPDHSAAEIFPVVVSDGAGGAFIAIKESPSLDVLVARVDVSGQPVPSWAQIPIPGLYYSRTPPHVAAATLGGAWLVPEHFFPGASNTPYLVRAVAASGPTTPDPSWVVGTTHNFNSVHQIGAGRALITGKTGLWVQGANGSLSLAFVEATGTVTDIPTAIGLPGAWAYRTAVPELGLTALDDGAGGAWVLCEYSVASDPSMDFYRNVAAVRIGPDGTPATVPAARIVCSATGEQSEADLVGDGGGGALIVWTDHRDPAKAGDIYAAHLLGDGALAAGWPINGKAVASAAGDQFQPRAVPDAAGGAWLVWTDARSGENDIYYTHFTGNGSPAPGFAAGARPLCAAAGSQISPRITADGEGGFYAVWLDGRDGEQDLYGQHIHETGEVMPGWTDGGLPICTEASEQGAADVVLSSPHHGLATWTDSRTGYPKVYAAAMPEDASVAGVPLGRAMHLSLAPLVNPARDGVELRLSSPDDGPIRVALVDVIGRVRAEQILSGPVRDVRVRFDPPGPGLYFLKAEQRGALASGRVAVVL